MIIGFQHMFQKKKMGKSSVEKTYTVIHSLLLTNICVDLYSVIRCYLSMPDGKVACDESASICWWHMNDGKVLGVHGGQIVEYDSETLSPLGIVVTKKELNNREVLIVDNSRTMVLIDPTTEDITVVHPNEDGSYWRKYQRNKQIRQEEKAREAAAKLWLERKVEMQKN